MKISREWLQTFFDAPLPEANELAHALTFHAFEIESIENDILDVKVTPNRGHDCLSHRGIAKELAAILNIPMTKDPFGADKGGQFDMSATITVSVADAALCPRYIAWAIKGVKVGPSPDWLKRRLESIGERSINNIVDATNYVMFTLGQPLHAFDADMLKVKNPKIRGTTEYAVGVRLAKAGEKITSLDGKVYELSESNLLIVKGESDEPVGIAGVKGGMNSGVSDETRDLVIESANFNGVSVRKTSQALKLRTSASQRFEQVLAPELAAFGMRSVAALIRELAGGELAGFADVYPSPQEKTKVSVSLTHINECLGTSLSATDVEDAFTRLALSFEGDKNIFTVESPPERLDLNIPEDLVEEVGRIVGYDKVPTTELPELKQKTEVNENFYAAEKAREELISLGYSEVITSVFADKGERVVANKVDGVRPYLRATLIDGLKEAHERNARNKDLLGLDEVKLFEIGIAWKKGKELFMLGMADKKGVKEKELESSAARAYDELPTSKTEHYQPFSKYPHISRDIALWVPKGTSADEVFDVIKHHAGGLLVRSWKFDEFAKGDKVSYAFRLVFQSPDRTLFDGDANERMESIYMAVKEKGWEVR